MKQENKIVIPGSNGTLIDENGMKLTPPEGWALLAAGDAGITKKVKAKGLFWKVQVQRGLGAIRNYYCGKTGS